MHRGLGPLVLAAVASSLALVPAASAAPASRAEYAGQVNPICAAANAHAAKAAAAFDQKKGWKKAKQSEKLYFALFKRINRIYAAAIAPIEQVRAAPGDEGLVSTWVGNRRRLLTLNDGMLRLERKMSRALSGSKPTSFKKFLRLERKLDRLYRKSERLSVLDLEIGAALGLTYCVTPATGLFSARSGN